MNNPLMYATIGIAFGWAAAEIGLKLYRKFKVQKEYRKGWEYASSKLEKNVLPATLMLIAITSSKGRGYFEGMVDRAMNRPYRYQKRNLK